MTRSNRVAVAPRSPDSKKTLGNVVQIDEKRIHDHLGELVRGTVEETLNGLLDAEADALCGAQRYARSPDRTDYRAGSYDRKLHTKAGEVTLKMPKLRKQAFETAIIERYRRRDISIEEAIVQMYLAGVSVRRVEDITEALWGTRVSSGTVSKLNQKVYKHIEAWRTQPIEGTYAYVYLDGIVLKRSWGGEVKNVSVLAAIGVDLVVPEGRKYLVGVVGLVGLARPLGLLDVAHRLVGPVVDRLVVVLVALATVWAFQWCRTHDTPLRTLMPPEDLWEPLGDVTIPIDRADAIVGVIQLAVREQDSEVRLCGDVATQAQHSDLGAFSGEWIAGRRVPARRLVVGQHAVGDDADPPAVDDIVNVRCGKAKLPASSTSSIFQPE